MLAGSLMGLFLSVSRTTLCKVYSFQPMLPDLLRYLRYGSWCLKYPQTTSSFLWCLHTCGMILRNPKVIPKVCFYQIGSAYSLSLMSPSYFPFPEEFSAGKAIIRDYAEEWNTWKYEICRKKHRDLFRWVYIHWLLYFETQGLGYHGIWGLGKINRVGEVSPLLAAPGPRERPHFLSAPCT